MRSADYAVMGVRQPQLDQIRFSQAERTLLRRTADLLEKIRTERNARVPTDWYAGEEDDSDLVFGWRICDEMARTGQIDAERVK